LTGTATSNTSSSRSAPRSPGFRDEPKKRGPAITEGPEVDGQPLVYPFDVAGAVARGMDQCNDDALDVLEFGYDQIAISTRR
ncbi:hypothetical protein, partial [Burkholderia pseudomallei]|uniref:hypothetical protein n=1 Tax=Burkholderia pseudomallei TaxID=28450 RepID=UPI001C7E5587